MKEPTPAMVVLGGPQILQARVRHYLDLVGWGRHVYILAPGNEHKGPWIARVAAQITQATVTGDWIVVFVPDSLLPGWEGKVRRAGRKVETPFKQLEIAGILAWLEKRIDLENQKRRPAGVVRGMENVGQGKT